MSPKPVSEAQYLSRDQEMLDAAVHVISEESVSALSMDKVAACVPYSKGTVYKHFGSKEDLLLGLCNRNMSSLDQFFQRATNLDGSSLDRVFAIAFAYLTHSLLNTQQFMLMVNAKTPQLYEKCSADRLAHHLELEEAIFSSCTRSVIEAEAAGDLVLPQNMCHKAVSFQLWSSSFGCIALCLMRENHPSKFQLIPERELLFQFQLVTDGLGWKPLSKNWDCESAVKKLREDVFPKEVARLETMGYPMQFCNLKCE